jgi:hypothetical protein
MERKIFLSVFIAALIAVALAVLLPGGRTVDKHPRLPWLIRVDETGYSTVFGLTLGRSTLAEVQEAFQEQGKTNLFVSPEQRFYFETYFKGLYLDGIRADLVFSLEVNQATAEQLYDRGLRISQLGNGTRKIELAQPDLDLLGHARVTHITYVPGTNLEPDLIAARFGEPARQIAEASGITHWLYPDRGLDIAVNPDGREIFQYVMPARFNELLEPLETQTN